MEFKRILLRKKSLGKFFIKNEFSLGEIDKVISNLNEIRSEFEKIEHERKQEEEKRIQVIKEVKEQMDALGINIDDIVVEKFKKTRKVAPKYRLIDKDGKPHEWSGRGRAPKVFQERFDLGARKEDFLIQTSD